MIFCEMNYVIFIILGEIMELARISISDDFLQNICMYEIILQ